jgi:hypothetical protein
MPKAKTPTRWVWLGVIVLLFVAGCNSRKTTGPIDQPEETAQTVMQQYFPLNYGDSWTWEVTSFQIKEEFADGDYSLGEPFEDSNHNGIWDFGESFEDVNYNGKYDNPGDPWESPIPYIDRNGNGEYDQPNGTWEADELFLDLDDDGVCGTAETLTLYSSILHPYPQNGAMILGGQFLGTYSDGEPGGKSGPTDMYSNDSLGLRLHGKGTVYDICQPLIIAQADPQVGDSIVSATCRYVIPTWISVFVSVEDVIVPAGSFQDCFKFKLIASGWTGEMARLNGTSYHWYAKDVGLVKVEGPKAGEYWILKSATIN